MCEHRDTLRCSQRFGLFLDWGYFRNHIRKPLYLKRMIKNKHNLYKQQSVSLCGREFYFMLQHEVERRQPEHVSFDKHATYVSMIAAL